MVAVVAVVVQFLFFVVVGLGQERPRTKKVFMNIHSRDSYFYVGIIDRPCLANRFKTNGFSIY